MKKLIYIFFAMMLFVTASCVRDAFEEPVDTAGNIVLSSSSSRIITKSGLQFVDFPAGTTYQLYAVPSADNPENYDWSRALLYDTPGVEEINHTINYGTPIPFRINEALDFYGVTANKKGRILNIASEGENSGARDVKDSPVFDVVRDNHDAAELHCHTMPDLMCSDNLKGRESKHGILQMEFIHTMSKLTFLISRESGAFSLPEMKPVLTGIEIIGGTWTRGMYDLVNDSWTLNDSDKCSPEQSSRYFAGELEIMENVVNVPFSADGTDTSHEMLIIPNADGIDEAYAAPRISEPLKVRISYRIGTEDKTHVVDIMKAVAGTDGTVSVSNYNFLKNHHYHLGITLLNDGVHVFAIRPMMYDWIDRDMENDTEVVLGQPVTFGGVMWMDRNLGATSPDAVNDFYHSIGYYYQYGRNIPYILDVDKWVAYVNDDNQKYMTDTNGAIDKKGPMIMFKDVYDGKADGNLVEDTDARNNPAKYYDYHYTILRYHGDRNSYTQDKKDYLYDCCYKCVYTYDNNGKKTYGFTYPKGLDKLARFPGDNVSDGVDPDDGFNNAYQFVSFKDSNKYLYDKGIHCENWLSDNERTLTLWDSPDNHPCPKGWRVPNVEDLYSFMPEWPSILVWTEPFYPMVTESDIANNTTSAKYPNYYEWTTRDGRMEEARFGKLNVDGVDIMIVYMLKNKGTTDAYRIKIRVHLAASWDWSLNVSRDSKGNIVGTHTGVHNIAVSSRNKHAITISRYPAKETDELSDFCLLDNNTNNVSQSDEDKVLQLQREIWDNPSEEMSFPGAGYIVTDGIPDLRSFGLGTIIRTSDAIDKYVDNNLRTWNYVMYLSTRDDRVFVADNSRRSLGDQIRCVRDVEVTDE